jgi:hypothetical protein
MENLIHLETQYLEKKNHQGGGMRILAAIAVALIYVLLASAGS